MTAAYDNYDYPSYWIGREYEHASEVIALKSFFKKIPRINTVVDIGAGFGRITPIYLYRAKKMILVDPSLKLLRLAKRKLKSRKIVYLLSTVENIHAKLRKNTADVVVFVRVMHHIRNLDKALSAISRLGKKHSYLILEFPNKRHLKATFLQLFKGNLTFPIDIFPRDLRSKRSIKMGTLPFVNYHPDYIKEKLAEYNYKVIEVRSVSNIRSSFLKRNIPLEFLLHIENFMQSVFSKLTLGPSIFILAKKM